MLSALQISGVCEMTERIKVALKLLNYGAPELKESIRKFTYKSFFYLYTFSSDGVLTNTNN